MSDFLPAEPFTESRVSEIFGQYLEILKELEILDLFEPVERRVTLSTHANVRKPDRRLFELAMERLGVSPKFEDSLFITENDAHIAAARMLGMDCLKFGIERPGGFADWPTGLLKIALKVDPAKNMALAITVLGRERGLGEVRHVVITPSTVTAEATTLMVLDDPQLGELNGVYVSVPATVDVDLKAGAPHLHVQLSEDAKAEATAFARSLQAHGKLSNATASLLGPPTHIVETDQRGRRVLKRRGFD
ncbi:MAG: hypothetical protein RLO21_08450 [Nitratireductor sp.]